MMRCRVYNVLMFIVKPVTAIRPSVTDKLRGGYYTLSVTLSNVSDGIKPLSQVFNY